MILPKASTHINLALDYNTTITAVRSVKTKMSREKTAVPEMVQTESVHNSKRQIFTNDQQKRHNNVVETLNHIQCISSSSSSS